MPKNYKRVITRRDFLRLSALGAGAAFIASCTPQATEVVEGPTVTEATVKELAFWTGHSAPPDSESMDRIVDSFNAANPDIKLIHTKYEDVPFETNLKTAYSGGQPPDLNGINGGAAMWQYAAADELVDLTDFITPMLPDMLPSAEIDIRYGGKLWAIPYADWIGNLIFYNADMLKEHGIAEEDMKTWEGFLDVCEYFKNAGITPIAFGNKEGWNGDHWISHLMQRMYGERDFEAVHLRSVDPSVKTDLKFTDDPGVKAWEYYKDLLDRGYFSSGYLSDDWVTAYTYFLQGKAAFHQTGGWYIGTVRSEAPDFPLDFVLFPEVGGYPGKQESVTSGGLNLVIAKKSEYQEEAKKFLKYWTTEEPNRIWAEHSTGLPFFKFDTANWDIDPLAQKEVDLMQAAPAATKFNDHLMDYEVVSEHVWNASQGILSGDLSPQEAAENLENAVVKYIEEKF